MGRYFHTLKVYIIYIRYYTGIYQCLHFSFRISTKKWERGEKSRRREGRAREIILHILHLFYISSIHHEGHGARLSRARRRLVASYALYTAGLSASIVIIILGPVDGVAGGRWDVSNSFCAPAGTLCRSPSALVLIVHAATASRPSRSPS